MKKRTKRFILISDTNNVLAFESAGFSNAEVVGILTIMRDSKIIDALNTKTPTNEKPI